MKSRHLRNVRGFFSDYYLGTALGISAGRGRRRTHTDRETDFAFLRFLRIRERAKGRSADAASFREKFLRPFLRDILGYHLGAGEDRIHGLFTSAEAEERRDKPLLVAYCGAWDEDLNAGRGAANPRHKTEMAIVRTGLRYGLLLSGERVRLIRAPGEGPRGSYLEGDLEGLGDDEDSESFPFLLRFYSSATFTPDSEGKTLIDDIERESRKQAERVSDDLKRAVFTAAESLVSGLIDDAVVSGRFENPLELQDAELRSYRDAALTCLYRILFILYAEARDTRLDSHQLYREGYSAQGLLDEVLDNIAFSWPVNRSSLWQRLRALFWIYDKGLPRISRWENIPPRGSDFFSSETPEGAILDKARLSDRVVARLMLDLATSTPRTGVGRERVSFRELDIENLGAVYEGLLEYEPRIARETTLEIHVQGRLFALTPADVCRLCEQKDLSPRGDFALVADTACAAFHPESAAFEEEEAEEEQEPSEDRPDSEELDAETGAEDDEEPAVERGASARIVRRLDPGMFHFVPGPSRKGSGSFYTPRPLVQDLVRHSLGPLVKGKSYSEIERLRILDPACGSAHFLVEAMRFLGQALHRAYVEEGNGRPPRDFRSTTGQGWDADWRASDEEARFSNSEARAWCKRRVAERCLFGVDLNPTAVQLARVALWIESAAGDRPLTYFEHHVRCGNSLLGTWMERLDRPPLSTLDGHAPLFSRGEARHQFGIFQSLVRKAAAEAAELRRLIDAADPDSLRREGREPESVEEQEYKNLLRHRADEILAAVKLLFDLRSASAFILEIWAEWDYLCDKIRSPEDLRSYVDAQEWRPEFKEVLARERFFHWELEFPEVLLDETRPGFDAVLGNPPWDKILPNRHEFYARYDVLIRAFKGGELDQRIVELNRQNPSLPAEFVLYRDRINTIASVLKKSGDFAFNEWEIEGKATGGHQDAFKYFVERAWRLAAQDGRVGFIVPSAIYNNEGCTGLRHLLFDETSVERFYGFENRRKIFPIDSRYKFISLVFRKAKPEAEAAGFEAAFMRHDLEELDETALWREPGKEGKSAFPGPIPWAVSVRRDELERLSPGTLAFLEYQSPRDREILLKMYEGRPLLGDQGPGTWNARFYTEFNMTNDRDLWTDPKTNKLWTPRQILGFEPEEFIKTKMLMAEKGFWPLYQDAHIHQYVLEFKPLMRWLNLEAHIRKYEKLPDAEPKNVIRDQVRNTDERTCIAARIPGKTGFGHTLNGIQVQSEFTELIICVINSLSFDFLARIKIGGQHASPYLLENIVVPKPEQSLAKKIKLVEMRANQQRKWIYDASVLWQSLWNIEKCVAIAYSLTPDDYEYLLSTFPIFARKRPGFFGYLLKQIAEWKAEIEDTKIPARAYLPPGRHEIQAAAETHREYGDKKTGNRKKKSR